MWVEKDKSARNNGVGNIFIKNLDASIDHKTLFDTFSMFGSIKSCKVSYDGEGNSLGYGFVHYTDPKSAEAAIEKSITQGDMTKYDLANQAVIARQLPVAVRVVGLGLGFLAVICTWEALDHLVVYLFPASTLQIVAYCVLLAISLLQLWLAKRVTDSDWVELGSLGFTLGSVAGAAATWGLVGATVRIYFEKSARLAAWATGSLIFLAASFVYMLFTKHNALLDIASCANSLGYFDKDDGEEATLETSGENYKGCA